MTAPDLESQAASVPPVPVSSPSEEGSTPFNPWEDTARVFARNADYYRGLVDEIGVMLGDAAFVADDGTRSDSVLRAKVPELVRARLSTPAPVSAPPSEVGGLLEVPMTWRGVVCRCERPKRHDLINRCAKCNAFPCPNKQCWNGRIKGTQAGGCSICYDHVAGAFRETVEFPTLSDPASHIVYVRQDTWDAMADELAHLRALASGSGGVRGEPMVYVLTREHDYEGESAFGVFASLDAAQAHVAAWMAVNDDGTNCEWTAPMEEGDGTLRRQTVHPAPFVVREEPVRGTALSSPAAVPPTDDRRCAECGEALTHPWWDDSDDLPYCREHGDALGKQRRAARQAAAVPPGEGEPPGHTDLMVPPESLDAHFAAHGYNTLDADALTEAAMIVEQHAQKAAHYGLTDAAEALAKVADALRRSTPSLVAGRAEDDTARLDWLGSGNEVRSVPDGYLAWSGEHNREFRGATVRAAIDAARATTSPRETPDA